MTRTILHSDMNNCYASIERKLNPSLVGKRLVVCGSVEDRHSIVLAKSYEAKAFGVKTGDSLFEAKMKCPGLVAVKPHYDEYFKFSKLAHKIYYSYTNQVEPFGLDECWLDVTGSEKLFGSGETIAHEIKERIKKELGITVSIGVSYNKIFAKLGSDLKKPDAVTIISKNDFKEIVWPLSTDAIIGIGSKTKKKLMYMNINTLGELAKADVNLLKRKLGIRGLYLWQYANGYDTSEVCDYYHRDKIKSISRGVTTKADLNSYDEVKKIFEELAIEVSKKLIEENLKAGGVRITIRDKNLDYVSFQKVFTETSISALRLNDKAMELFKERYDFKEAIRSLTISAINLTRNTKTEQLSLFAPKKVIKDDRLEKVFNEIREKFGSDKIGYFGLELNSKMPEKPSVVTLPSGFKNMI
ncbi:MAG: DNA polymerase IV [Eubacteriales bacterium]|uniref:DNA polymerase IV n=1 Tax=Fenollaria sp. TaxID=1965292 RepID=UPI002A75C42A|nr:DNA polymerase IV [Fenollaria sp.]MDD7340190.1 DNA polymerase IV [Eubacteriales bacterium]MDY3105501.1 DNA polymerase IV [Fenollaria sp.]